MMVVGASGPGEALPLLPERAHSRGGQGGSSPLLKIKVLVWLCSRLMGSANFLAQVLCSFVEKLV